MYFSLILGLVLLARWAWLRRQRERAREQGRRLHWADEALVRMERAIGSEDWEYFDRERRDLAGELDGLAPIGRPRIEVLFHLVDGDARAARGQFAEARSAYRHALEATRQLPPEPARECALRAQASMGVVIEPGADAELAQAEDALQHADEARWPITRARLLQAALELARFHRHLGRTERAFEHYARARRLGSGLDGESVRGMRVRAAAECARLKFDEGHADEGHALLEEAVEDARALATPEGRELLAELLLLAARQDSPGALVESAPRAARLREAQDAGLESATPMGRLTAARAALLRAPLVGAEGDHADAARLALEAREWVEGLEGPVIRHLRLEASLIAAQAWLAAEDFAAADDVFGAAMSEGLGDELEENRALARIAGFKQHAVRCASERFEDADAVLERLEDAGLSLTGEPRALFEAELARGRGFRAWRSGQRGEARRQLEQALAILAPLPDELASQPRWASASDLGRALLEAGDAAAAIPWLEVARDAAAAAEVAIAERVSGLLLLAQALDHASRSGAALETLRAAYDLGRTSGDAAGRLQASIAAMNLALGLDDDDDRIAFCDAAANLARLSGLPAAEQVVRDATRLRRTLEEGGDEESADE